MSGTIKISIVVAAYNVEKYIKSCLDSVINQTYDNFEVIVVNDGSTDNTREICESYDNIHSRMKLINQENVGLSNTRKVGVRAASGEYVLFLDGDDWLRRETLDICYNALRESNAECIQFGMIKAFKLLKIKRTVKPYLLSKKEVIDGYLPELLGSPGQMISRNVCSKIFKREILLDIYQNHDIELNYGEDAYLNILFITHEKTKLLKSVDQPWYFYRQNSGMMSQLSWQMIHDYGILKSIQIDMLRRYKYNEQYVFQCHVESVYVLVDMINYALMKDVYDNVILNCKEIYQLSYIKDAQTYFKHTRMALWKDLEMFYSLSAEKFVEYVHDKRSKEVNLKRYIRNIKKQIRKYI